MGRIGALILLLMGGAALWAGGKTSFQEWKELQERGDFTGALDVLLDILAENPDNAGARKCLKVTTAAIERKSSELDVLAREDRGPAVDRALQALNQEERETRQALNNLRASYENKWRTTPESLLHTCRGVELQMQISLSDDSADQRHKEYLRNLCLSLSSGAAAGVLPADVDIHRVSGFLAYQRLDFDPALTEWKRALSLDPSDRELSGFVREIENEQRKDERRSLSRKKFGLAETKYSEGNYRAALGYYREGLALDSTNRFAAEEVKRLEKMLQRESQRADLGRRIGRAREAQSQGRRQDAAREWLAVLKEDPLNTEARENLGRLSEEWGVAPPAKAAKSPVRPKAQDKERAADYYSKGLMEYSRGDLSAARKAFEQCVALAPEDEMAARALERVVRQLKNRP
jgi:tetratricopeptide (TPR) repeat protein